MSTSRREFICGAVGLALLTPTACVTAPTIRASVRDSILYVDLAEWPEEESVVVVRRDDRKSPVIVLREGDSFHAVSSICTHQGCIVRPQAGSLVCPCHGSVFSTRGEVRRGPAVDSLARLQTQVDGTRLLIAVPEEPV